MDDVLKDFITQKSDQITKAHTIADLAYNSIQTTNAEIKLGFSELSKKMDAFHANFVPASLYQSNRTELLQMIAKLEREIDDEHKSNDETRGMIKKWGGGLAVIIFFVTFVLK